MKGWSRFEPTGRGGRSIVDRFWSKVAKTPGCWLWLGKTQKGYGYFVVRVDGKETPVRAHRFSWFLAHQAEPLPDAALMHTCDNPACVNPAHLVLGSHADNVADRVAKGRSSRKLSAADVVAIREARARGELLVPLAARFNVSHETVRLAALGVSHGSVR